MQPTTIGKYTVSFAIKKGLYAESYRVSDDLGNKYFLKLINTAKLRASQFSNSDNGVITECELLDGLDHPNITHMVEQGDAVLDGQKFHFIVCDFIAGETVYEKVTRERHCTVYDIKRIAAGVLNALKYLHQSKTPIIHNEITAQNVMLDMSKSVSVPILIDFGHAKRLSIDESSFYYDGLNPFYMAPELFNGVYSTRTDIYAVGALMYYLLFGMLPWWIDLKNTPAEEQLKRILEERRKPLKFPDIQVFELDENLLNIIAKALSQDVDKRFQSVNEFLLALNGEIVVRGTEYEKVDTTTSPAKAGETQKKNIRKGNGFADVAGLDDLKHRLQSEVIDLVMNPERYRKLRVQIPNGILLYGPPGCGKTFIAEKFAEELKCNYMYVHCSDVASPYIHGGQEKIAALFANAKKNAPTVLFLDEVDAMIADRSRHNNVSEYGEVNEFLTQLNNCAENQIIVIGATNNPQGIDPAALRTGRLDIKVYVPAPDEQTRKMLFELYLKDIADTDVDYTLLAQRTQGYVSKDIAVLVNKAALLSAQNSIDKISMKMLTEAVDKSKGELPSVSAGVIAKFNKIRDEFEGRTTRRPIGFN